MKSLIRDAMKATGIPMDALLRDEALADKVATEVCNKFTLRIVNVPIADASTLASLVSAMRSALKAGIKAAMAEMASAGQAAPKAK